jgi:hypothetical protein
MTSGGACTSSMRTPAPPMGESAFPFGWIKVTLCPEAPFRIPPGVKRTPTHKRLGQRYESSHPNGTTLQHEQHKYEYNKQVHTFCFHPIDCRFQIIYPQSNMIQCRRVNFWRLFGIQRCHEIHFDGGRSRTKRHDVFIHIFRFTGKGSRLFQAKDSSPQIGEWLFVERSNGNLLQTQYLKGACCWMRMLEREAPMNT